MAFLGACVHPGATSFYLSKLEKDSLEDIIGFSGWEFKIFHLSCREMDTPKRWHEIQEITDFR